MRKLIHIIYAFCLVAVMALTVQSCKQKSKPVEEESTFVPVDTSSDEFPDVKIRETLDSTTQIMLPNGEIFSLKKLNDTSFVLNGDTVKAVR